MGGRVSPPLASTGNQLEKIAQTQSEVQQTDITQHTNRKGGFERSVNLRKTITQTQSEVQQDKQKQLGCNHAISDTPSLNKGNIMTITNNITGQALNPIVGTDERIWFETKVILDYLEYNDHRETMRNLNLLNNEESSTLRNEPTLSHITKNELASKAQNYRDVPLITEFGLYDLLIASSQPKAREFGEWVTREVLPSIRKHGMYINRQENLTSESKDLLIDGVKGFISTIEHELILKEVTGERDKATDERDKAYLEILAQEKIITDLEITNRNSSRKSTRTKLRVCGLSILADKINSDAEDRGILATDRGYGEYFKILNTDFLKYGRDAGIFKQNRYTSGGTYHTVIKSHPFAKYFVDSEKTAVTKVLLTVEGFNVMLPWFLKIRFDDMTGSYKKELTCRKIDPHYEGLVVEFITDPDLVDRLIRA